MLRDVVGRKSRRELDDHPPFGKVDVEEVFAGIVRHASRRRGGDDFR